MRPLSKEITRAKMMRLREERGLSNREIAEVLDISVATVYRYMGKQGWRAHAESAPQNVEEIMPVAAPQNVEEIMPVAAQQQEEGKTAHMDQRNGIRIFWPGGHTDVPCEEAVFGVEYIHLLDGNGETVATFLKHNVYGIMNIRMNPGEGEG